MSNKVVLPVKCPHCGHESMMAIKPADLVGRRWFVVHCDTTDLLAGGCAARFVAYVGLYVHAYEFQGTPEVPPQMELHEVEPGKLN